MVRNVTYMAALAGARHNPALTATKQRLDNGGRPLKVVLVVLIRNLMTIFNAVIRNNAEWTPNPPETTQLLIRFPSLSRGGNPARGRSTNSCRSPLY